MSAVTPARFPATATLARFVAEWSREAATADLESRAKTLVLDFLAVTIAAARSEIVPVALAGVQTRPDGVATLAGQSRGSAGDAAFFNGVLAHALEFDDSTLNPVGHPGSVILPALLAASEEGAHSGARFLEAWLVGLEVHSRLGAAQRGNWSFEGGWLPIGHISLLGAAAGCAKLLGLDAARTEHAFALAAQFSGQLSVNAGSHAKPLGAGHSARAGLLAARFAAAGGQGVAQVIERPGGFADTFFGVGTHDLGTALQKLGAPHHLQEIGVAIKRYPSCYGCHWGVDAVLDLVAQHDLQPERIDAIELAHPAAAAFLDRPDPRTEEEAKFSHEFNLAVAALHGIPRAHSFAPEVIASDALQRMLSRVRTSVHAPDAEPSLARAYRVTVTTTDGRMLSHEVARPLGHPRRPMSEADLEDKFRHCVAGLLSDADAAELRTRVASLEREADMRGIARLLGRVGADHSRGNAT